ncbi:hypothetical protein OI70_16580 [Dickeya fangzhongdai]|nr:hypothetical protein OI70_16580 [Dickeya fangzhongdai]
MMFLMVETFTVSIAMAIFISSATALFRVISPLTCCSSIRGKQCRHFFIFIIAEFGFSFSDIINF